MKNEKLNLLELAREGNECAIAAIINRWLKPKGITTKAKKEEKKLELNLEAEKVPNLKVLILFIRKVFETLEINNIEKVQIFLYLTGESSPVWQEEFEILPQSVKIAAASETASPAMTVAESVETAERLLPVEETATQEETTTTDMKSSLVEKDSEVMAFPWQSTSESKAPTDWLDKRMGKALVILCIYLISLVILGSQYMRQRLAPTPNTPKPTVSNAPGR
ncbi:MAG: hypothetical protein N3E45_01990 [Oscillatoriaceae bacterium SKW80]|nr:hypothetical protein [Oscillatoriaceae bacterium SKYG93]MCX8119598.1 hypothetical protein [Oscillatoriaceae bacterium SKW80]MDW8455065.1 hypothetical protein [Oscillatoriaceae cyanobacterium SKYGB_i_bin93]HIK28158.1 hypothetical protein [Oscillatoriaceae cyanobacterium M7585_C2015_266]